MPNEQNQMTGVPSELDGEVEALLDIEEEETAPLITLSVTRSNMEAEIRFTKTSAHTLDPKVEDVMALLAEQGVVYGIEEKHIQDLCAFPTYDENFVVARGKAAGVGEDGTTNLLIRTTRVLKPTIMENGMADYKDLGYIQNVKKGQPLCEIIPPTKGEDGVDVLGNVLEGKMGRPARAPAGGNTEVNEENTQIVSLVDGHVEVVRGTIHVQEVLRINGNVDNSTGNITFAGDVFINGDVISGFAIDSGGSIVVKGTVEGATLRAKNDITISEGINGMDRGALEAGGVIKCRYMQHCYVKSGEDIYADTIMYCVVECGGNIELSGKRCALIGGRTSISGTLQARTIGTESHAATELNMAVNSNNFGPEIAALDAQIQKLDIDITKLVQVLTRFDELHKQGKLDAQHVETIRTVKGNYVTLSESRKKAVQQREFYRQEQLKISTDDSYIKCKDRVHTGVRITFGSLSMLVQESFTYSRIYASGGEIIVAPL